MGCLEWGGGGGSGGYGVSVCSMHVGCLVGVGCCHESVWRLSGGCEEAI